MGRTMHFDKVTPGDRIVVVAGLLLIVDLIFLPWHEVATVMFGQTIAGTATGIQFPNGFYGILAILLVLVMIGHIVARLADAGLPALRVPWAQRQRIAGIAVLVLLLVKLLSETSFLGPGAFLGVLLGGALAWGGARPHPSST